MTNKNNNSLYKSIKNKSGVGILILSIVSLFNVSSCFAQDQENIQLANEYYLNGEREKAIQLYRELEKSEANVPVIHNFYLNTMLDLGTFDEAISYLSRRQRMDPGNVYYNLDIGYVYNEMGDLAKADKQFKDVIASRKGNVTQIKIVSDYFSHKHLYDYGVQALKAAQDQFGNTSLFTLELAMLYRLQGKKNDMVREYLNYVTQTSANVQRVKNVLQSLLTSPEDLESLQNALYQRIQQSPDEEVYTDLLIWVNMQQKNFYGAFVQARAYDRRFGKVGEKCFEVAAVAAANTDYAMAATIFGYIISEYPNSPYYLASRLGLIRTREAEVKTTYPVNRDSVNRLVSEYTAFIRDYPNRTESLEATRNQALLFANYLDRVDTAIVILNNLINNPRTVPQLAAYAKLDLGDIYLINEEPWESALLYAQVEKTLKETPVGYEAKLKGAKLSYYRADFQLAQEHLDILKEATTREIANDAMDLSMRIKENIAYDTLGLALKHFSSIELLQYRNKISEALDQLELLKQGKIKMPKTEADQWGYKVTEDEGDSVWVTYRNKGILDDTYWLEARIRMQIGEFDKALELLGKILQEHGQDILADDAMFLEAEIYERQLDDKEKAMDLYREFLGKFPGSVYAAEARKRFRMLRGDFTTEEGFIPIGQ